MDTVEQIEKLIKGEKYDKALEILGTAIDEFGAVAPNELEGSHRTKLLRLRQLEGHAHTRRGQLEKAHEILKSLIDQGFDDAETLGLYARTLKDFYYRSGDRSYLLASRDTYASAFEAESDNVDHIAYVGINAAAMSLLLRDSKAAIDYSYRVTEVIGKPDLHDYWLDATIAEAELIRALYKKMGKERNTAFERAADLYRRAVDYFPKERGSHGSTWLQARRLLRSKRASPQERDRIWFAFRHLTDDAPSEGVLEPPYRRLRVYAFDPNSARQLETATVNELTLQVVWEERQDTDGNGDPEGPPNLRGPVGKYLEVVDIDPASGCVYEPIDLNDRRLLAKDGTAPSVGDPQFHQQMVYAVGMNVIAHFERALGRRALWSDRKIRNDKGEVIRKFVERLRVYPHALREANAYYTPTKKALLFGYFPAEANAPSTLQGGVVFTCLSHDIIAHEMSHALMDGLHPRFAEPTNVDVLAFHEAFADIVALFQHFSHPEVLRHEIARTRGKLNVDTYLGQLAQEFGQAIGRRGALRDAIGKKNEKGQWQRLEPEPDALAVTAEPHKRGAILVAAIFDAFLAIYESRTKDLFRIATQGSGILAPGEIHPDLVNRLASEAAKVATHILHLCIRALDYCPPVDLRFGDYLRAMITADVDVVPNDKHHYRLALIESFQRRGIRPDDVGNLSVESLIWRPPRGSRIDLSGIFTSSSGSPAVAPEWRSTGTRRELWAKMRDNAGVLHNWLMTRCSPEVADEIGLHLEADAPPSFYFKGKRPAAEVHSFRVAHRSAPNGSMHTDLVVEITQRRRGYLQEDKQNRVDSGQNVLSSKEHGDFTFRGGCTLLIDPATGRIRYAISKHILSEHRLRRQQKFFSGYRSDGHSLRATYFGDETPGTFMSEPFAVLHRSPDD